MTQTVAPITLRTNALGLMAKAMGNGALGHNNGRAWMGQRRQTLVLLQRLTQVTIGGESTLWIRTILNLLAIMGRSDLTHRRAETGRQMPCNSSSLATRTIARYLHQVRLEDHLQNNPNLANVGHRQEILYRLTLAAVMTALYALRLILEDFRDSYRLIRSLEYLIRYPHVREPLRKVRSRTIKLKYQLMVIQAMSHLCGHQLKCSKLFPKSAKVPSGKFIRLAMAQAVSLH